MLIPTTIYNTILVIVRPVQTIAYKCSQLITNHFLQKIYEASFTSLQELNTSMIADHCEPLLEDDPINNNNIIRLSNDTLDILEFAKPKNIKKLKSSDSGWIFDSLRFNIISSVKITSFYQSLADKFCITIKRICDETQASSLLQSAKNYISNLISNKTDIEGIHGNFTKEITQCELEFKTTTWQKDNSAHSPLVTIGLSVLGILALGALITIGIYGTVKAYKWWTTVKENQIENKATEQEYTSVPINNLEADHDDLLPTGSHNEHKPDAEQMLLT